MAESESDVGDYTDYDGTESLSESLFDYPVEHGRRYHKYHEGAYVYPNDEQELDRLDLQHHLTKMVLSGKLFLAPLRNPCRILDIGTGTGIWPIEMASIFPDAEITGTDLSPVQPEEVPENVYFIVDDATEEEWLWGENHFDFIRTSLLAGSIPSIGEVVKKAMKYTKPGGYFECIEIDSMLQSDDGTLPPMSPDSFSSYPVQDWLALIEKAGLLAVPPRQLRIAHDMERCVKEAGFVDVKVVTYKIPISPWSSDPRLKQLGTWMQVNWLEALAGWSYKPFSALGWSKEEMEVFLSKVRQSIHNLDVHAYHDCYVVTGTKPVS